jgi:hypothetical protein
MKSGPEGAAAAEAHCDERFSLHASGSPKTLGHSPKARLVVTMTEVRS